MESKKVLELLSIASDPNLISFQISYSRGKPDYVAIHCKDGSSTVSFYSSSTDISKVEKALTDALEFLSKKSDDIF